MTQRSAGDEIVPRMAVAAATAVKEATLKVPQVPQVLHMAVAEAATVLITLELVLMVKPIMQKAAFVSLDTTYMHRKKVLNV